ncbi:MAG: DNA translocase FtsK, partial [candidate division WOR-3 bacterium]
VALLDAPDDTRAAFKDPEEAQQEANLLIEKLRQFGIDGRILEIQSGPMITRFELEPAPGVKVQRIESLADDLSLALSAERIRILAPIPGKSAVGIEIPNKERRTVYLREVLVSAAYRQEKSPLGFALGTTITGEPYCGDLRTMPHMLIAGTTGSGKSVCINSLIMSIIYRSSPQEVRFLTIDPKQLELPVYNSIPHLLSTTTTDPKQAVDGLTRMVGIMEARYGEFANLGVRDIAAYNAMAEEQGLPRKPYIVVVIDELADLMLRAPNEIEERITRLAQMSRAVGIHLVLATQRPSVDVITGLIKANFPCRVAFQVASKTDSRTILDMNGAESLLGRGDMLFLPPGKGEPVRLHGAFVSDQAAQRIVRLWTREYLAGLLTGLVDDPKAKAAEIVKRGVADVFYDRERAGTKKGMEVLRSLLPDEVIDSIMGRPYHEPLPEERDIRVMKVGDDTDAEREIDEKFAEAARIVVRHREASVSMLQRRLDVGWARAGRIIDQLEQAGIVGPYVGSKSRRVLVESEAELEKFLAKVNTNRG